MITARLRTYDLSMLVVSMVMGIGIFRTPQLVAAHSPSLELFYAAWVVGALLSVCGALSFAEIGTRMPVAGGYYAIFAKCYHPMIAFAMNWTLVIMNAASTASVALIGVEYFGSAFLPQMMHGPLRHYLVIGLLLSLYGLNLLGLQTGVRAQNILSSLKLLLAFVLCGSLVYAPWMPQALADVPTHVNNSLSQSSSVLPSPWLAFGSALMPVFFSYGGYQSTINLGADIHQPSRTIPRAILVGMFLILAVYMCLNMSYVHVLGFERVQDHPLVASALGTAMFGRIGQSIVSLAIFVSVLGFLNTAFVFNPRICYAMAQEQMLPSSFARVHPFRQTQPLALSVFAALSIVAYLFLRDFENILGFVMFNDCLSLSFAVACLFILRRRNIGSGSLYTVPSLIIPLLFICCLVGILISIVVSTPQHARDGCAVIAAGALLYALRRVYLNRRGAQKT